MTSQANIRGEIAATFALGWPIVLTNVAVNFMTTTDVIFLGRLSPEALAAGTLGFNVYTPPFLFCVGVVSAAAPLAAAKIGADAQDFTGARNVGRQAFLSSIALAVPLWLFFWNTEPILRAIGEPPALADLAGRYMHGLQWALGPALLYFSARSVLAALDRTAPVLIVGLLAVGFNALANYVLVFGHWGAPSLGAFGSGLATTLSQTLMFALLVGYAAMDGKLRTHRLMSPPWRFDPVEFGRLWRLGAPIGLFIGLEVAVFAYTALIMGLLGAHQLEAHAIALNIAATAFMVPLGLGMAATVRVGQAFGARDAQAVSRAGWTAFGMALAFVAVSATVMAAAPRLLISAFISTEAPENAETVAYAVAFVRVAAVFQLVDGAQAALSNMLRGVHDSRWPMVMALCGYWAIGAPAGLALAFLTPLGGVGLWVGLALGLAAVSSMLLLRWRAKQRRGFWA